MSPNIQICQGLEDSRTPTVTAKENADTLYDGRSAARKQLEPLWPYLGQLEDQVLEATPRSSFKLEMLEEYTNVSDQGPNRNPPKRLPAYNQHSGGIQTTYKLSGPTPLSNLT